MRKVLCFGNEYIDGDEVAKQVGREISLDGFEFILSDSLSDVLDVEGEIIILDVAKGIDKVSLIENVDDLDSFKSLSCHDLDLGFYLKLLKETGKIENVKIIGIPYGDKNLEKIKEDVEKILRVI
jgi:Ni,Fe-hydrogenase maturation factor